MSVNKRPGSVRSGGSSTATASASKKSVQAAEQDRPDVAAARTAWADNQPKLDPDRLITKPAPQPKWRDCVAGLHAANGWSAKSRTVTGKPPPLSRACAPQLLLHHRVIDGPMNGNAFLAYVEQVLGPTLKPGDIVVLDNLSAHKVSGIREAIEAAGAKLFYLPPYSPDSIRSSSSSQNLKRCSARPPSAR